MSQPDPVYFLALQQISTILSKALADCALVFAERARPEIRPEAPPAALATISPHSPTLQVEVAEAKAPQTTATAAPPKQPDAQEDHQPLEKVAQHFEISAATLYKLINEGKIARFKVPGKRLVNVSMAEVGEALKGTRRRRAKVAAGNLSPIAAATALGLTTQTLYSMIADGRFKGAVRDGSRIQIPIAAVEQYLQARGKALPAKLAEVAHEPPKSEAVQPAPAPEAPAAVEPVVVEKEWKLDLELTNKLNEIQQEIKELEQYLPSLTFNQRSSQLAIWAGMTRKVISDAGDIEAKHVMQHIRRRGWGLIAELRDLAHKYEVWVNALISEWDIEDWDLYIRSLNTTPPNRSKEEEEVLIEGDLRAMLLRPRRVPPEQARAVLEIAKGVLPANNPILFRANRMFTPIPPKAAPPEEPAPLPATDVAPEVLALTKNKRILIVGGQGERDANIERFMKDFQLQDCEWLTHEKGKAASVMRAANRLTLSNYDMVLFLTRFTGHAIMGLHAVAKRNGLPVVMCPKGYGVGSIASAISEQYSGAPVTTKTPKIKRPPERRAHA